jgi:hypothetical protein
METPEHPDSKVDIKIREGIIILTAIEGGTSDFNEVKRIIHRLRVILEVKERPVLADIRTLKEMSHRHRIWATEEIGHLFPATAFLTDSAYARMIASFFLVFNIHQKPVKIFHQKEEAIDWLRAYL